MTTTTTPAKPRASQERRPWTLRLSEPLAEQLRERAVANERGLAAEARHALRAWMAAGEPLVDLPDHGEQGSTRTIRVGTDQYDQLGDAASELGISKSNAMRVALVWYLATPA